MSGFPYGERQTFAMNVDVGASSGLSSGVAVLQLNTTFRDVDTLQLVSYMVKNASSPKLRIRFQSSAVPIQDNTNASQAGLMARDAIHLLVPVAAAAQVVSLAIPTPVYYAAGAQKHGGADSIQIEVRDWSGQAVTFDDLALQFVYTKQAHRNYSGADPRVINAGDNLLVPR